MQPERPAAPALNWQSRSTRDHMIDGGLWSLSATVVLLLLSGVTALALQAPVPEVAQDTAPPALMVELAPAEQAAESGETEVSPDQIDAQASQAVSPQAQSDPSPEPLPDMPQDISPVQPLASQPAELITPNDRIEVPIAMEEPAPPKPRTETSKPAKSPPKRKKPERPKPNEQAAQAASVAANKARSQETMQNRNVAPPSAAGRGSSLSPAKWQSRLLAHIERRKPRASGEYGAAAIGFTIDEAGNVTSVVVARSSGSARIDADAVATIRRASPVPQPPLEAPRSLTVEIKFDRR